MPTAPLGARPRSTKAISAGCGYSLCSYSSPQSPIALSSSTLHSLSLDPPLLYLLSSIPISQIISFPPPSSPLSFPQITSFPSPSPHFPSLKLPLSPSPSPHSLPSNLPTFFSPTTPPTTRADACSLAHTPAFGSSGIPFHIPGNLSPSLEILGIISKE